MSANQGNRGRGGNRPQGWECPNCGFRNPSAAKFCGGCGQPKPQVQQLPQGQIDLQALGEFIGRKVDESVARAVQGQVHLPAGDQPPAQPQPTPPKAGVPRLIDWPQQDAQNNLGQLGLTMNIQGYENSDLQLGNVVRQEPRDGTVVQTGTTVNVWLSSGQPAQPQTTPPQGGKQPQEEPWTIERVARETETKAENWRQIGPKEFGHRRNKENITVPSGASLLDVDFKRTYTSGTQSVRNAILTLQ